jgi:hypothetical protein
MTRIKLEESGMEGLRVFLFLRGRIPLKNHQILQRTAHTIQFSYQKPSYIDRTGRFSSLCVFDARSNQGVLTYTEKL